MRCIYQTAREVWTFHVSFEQAFKNTMTVFQYEVIRLEKTNQGEREMHRELSLEYYWWCTSLFPSSPSVSGPGFSSRLCKRALYSYFLQVAQRGGHSSLLELPTYHSIKVGPRTELLKNHEVWFWRVRAALWQMWYVTLLVVWCFAGRSCCVPDSQRSGQATVSEQPCRSLESKKAGGLLWRLNVLLVTVVVWRLGYCCSLYFTFSLFCSIPLLCTSNTVVFSLCRCLRKTRDPTVVHKWSSQFE